MNWSRPVLEVARDLVGHVLQHGETSGVIVETEAYHHSEPACHAHVGLTGRTRPLFGPPGMAYVYRSYGIHALFNAVCEEDGVGAAVLVRAIEPTDGIELMRARRAVHDVRLLCSGPGRLCQALAITRAHNGMRVDAPPFSLVPPPEPTDVVIGPRIGITKAVDVPWRFGLRGSRFLSRPFR